MINCPSCARQLKVPEQLEGKNVKCPSCAATFLATASGGSEAIPEPPPLPEEQSLEQGSPPETARRPVRRQDDEVDGDDYEDDRPRRRRRIRRDSEPHRGTLILVLGIVSIVACPLTGPFAWYMGNADLRKIRNGTMDPEGEGTTKAGWICGMVGTGLLALQVVLICIYFVFIALFFGAMAGGGGPGGKNFFPNPPGQPGNQ